MQLMGPLLDQKRNAQKRIELTLSKRGINRSYNPQQIGESF